MQKQKAVMTDAREMLSCGLVLRSIGYRSVAADVDLPFDTARSVVIQKPGKPLPTSTLRLSSYYDLVLLVLHDV